MSLRYKRGLPVVCKVLLLSSLLAFEIVKAETGTCYQILNDRCTKSFEARMDAPTANPASNKVRCTALAIYLRCVENVKKMVVTCNSDLYYRALSTLIPRLMRDRDCGNVTLPRNHTEAVSTVAPTSPATSQPGCKDFEPLKTTQNAYDFRLCALFGDPHLKTFTNDRQTCVVEGAWPLIDNEYFSVQVTNVPVVKMKSQGPTATATNTITVLIKETGKGCVDQKIFRAKAGSLPAEFLDGTLETGPKSCSARISQKRKGSQVHVAIEICYIRTMIIIRQVGSYLTFHVKIPKELLFNYKTSGLCVEGCPTLQRIDYRELLSYTDDQLARFYPGRAKMSRREARQKCVDSKIAGFYLDSCLFDLLTTGDQNFSDAAWHALDDSFHLDSTGTLKDLQTYNTTDPRDTEQGSGDGNSPGSGIRGRGRNRGFKDTGQPTSVLCTLLILFILLR